MHKLSTASHGLFATLYPSFFIAALVVGCILLVAHWRTPAGTREILRRATRPGSVALGVFIFGALYTALAFVVLTFPGFIDPGEPMIASASFFEVHGVPVYRLFIPYGPFCYAMYGIPLRLFGAGLGALKGTVFAGNLLLLGLLFTLMRKFLRPLPAALAVMLMLSACLMKQTYALQIRGDLFIYIAVVVALLSVLTQRVWAGIILLTVAITLAVGIKITAVLYLLYPCAVFLKRFGWKPLALVGIFVVVLSLAPFSLPNLNIQSYMYWLHQMSRQLRSAKELMGNLVTTILLLVPLALMLASFFRRDPERARMYLREQRTPILALLLGFLAVDVLGGKFGAGRHHLVPFVFVVGFIAAQMYAAMQSSTMPVRPVRAWIAYAWTCFGLLLFIAQLSEVRDTWAMTQTEKGEALALKRDVKEIQARFPGEKIELGSGNGLLDLDQKYSAQYAAAQLVFAGNPYTFDPSAQADLELMNLPISRRDLDYVRSCETPVWLIPRGDEPFHSLSIYSDMYPRTYPGHLLFTPELRQIFADTYALDSSSRFFDIYVCRRRS